MHKLTRKFFRALSSHDGLLSVFQPIDQSIPEEFELSAFFALGIFNPFGPTVTTIAKVSHPDQPNFLLLLSSLNPFAAEHLLLGSSTDDSLIHLVELIQAAFGRLCSGEESFLSALPTWFYPTDSPEGSVCLMKALEAMVAANQKFAAALPSHTRDSEKFKGRPWDRATDALDRALEQIGEKPIPASLKESEANQSVDHWYDLVTQPDYIGPEVQATLTAWQHVTSEDDGAFSQPGMAVMDVWELLEFLSRLQFAFAQQITAKRRS